MKKIIYHRAEEVETQTIYTDIEEVYGGWIGTTAGDPITLNDLENIEEDDLRDLEIAFYESLLAGNPPYCVDRYDILDCDEDDIEYVNGLLRLWGCDTITTGGDPAGEEDE